jgi:putative chitinase
VRSGARNLTRLQVLAGVRKPLAIGLELADKMKPQEAKDKLYRRLLADPRVNHDDRWIAYIMATVQHETAGTYMPIHEIGGNDYFTKRYEHNKKIAAALGNTQPGDGAMFHGRGFVQLTGRSNYDRFDRLLGADGDLLENPDMACEWDVAYSIMVIGMVNGEFTGKKLASYLSASKNDPVNARRIVNGKDCAQAIAIKAEEHLPKILALKKEIGSTDTAINA